MPYCYGAVSKMLLSGPGRWFLFVIALEAESIFSVVGAFGFGLQRPGVWHLTEEPLVTIGTENDTNTEFLRIRGVLRLPTGEIVVANGAPPEIRFFRPDGRFIKRFGREGSGPGEFRWIGAFGSAQGRLWVHDGNLGRLVWLTLDGLLLKTESTLPRAGAGHPGIADRLSDGCWLVWTSITPTLNRSNGTYEDSSRVGIAADRAGAITWIRWIHGPMFFVYRPAGLDYGLGVGPAAFSGWPVARSFGNRVVLGDPRRGVVWLHGPDGRLEDSIRLSIRPKRPDETIVATARELELEMARNESSRAFVRAKYEADVLPTALPVFQQILADPSGMLWIEGYGVQGGSVIYHIVDPAGRARATLTAPPGLRIHYVGADYALGVHTDQDGVERVHMYGLSRK